VEFILIFSSTLLVVYALWLFRTGKKANVAKQLYVEYQVFLNDKLTPLGFEKKEIIASGREKIISYKRDLLEVTLVFEIPFDSVYIFWKSGKKTTLKSVIDKMPPEIKDKMTNLPDQTKVVYKDDFSMELSNSAETKINFIRQLDNWLAEHP
jgi:hypothetical protein